MPTARPSSAAPAQWPRCWTCTADGVGGLRLCFAVRGGAAQAVLLVLGLALVAGGLWGGWALMRGEGEWTPFGWALLVAAPGGVLLAGVYVLDRALWARTEYVLAQGVFSERQTSLFARRRTDVARSLIVEISQEYTPPGSGKPAGTPGTWVTFVQWCEPGAELRSLALDGLHTQQERRWLGPLLRDWAGVPLRRGYGASAEEADPAEFPPD